MNQIQMWQLGVDIGLIATLLIVCVRFMKASQAHSMLPRTLELESSLRTLIGEADAAGSALNDQLFRREQNLQKLLQEIEAGEQRIARLVAQAEDREKNLNITVEKASEVAGELNRGLDDIRTELEPIPAPHKTGRREPPPQAPSFEEFAPPRTARPAAPQPQARKPQQSPERAKPQAQIQPESYPSQASLRDMRSVYGTAEELLRSGQSLEEVSLETNLDVEHVKRLSQMIEIERDTQMEVSVRKQSDDRLGVLGTGRRSTQSL